MEAKGILWNWDGYGIWIGFVELNADDSWMDGMPWTAEKLSLFVWSSWKALHSHSNIQKVMVSWLTASYFREGKKILIQI